MLGAPTESTWPGFSALPNATAVRWPSDGMHTANDLPYMTIRAYQLQGRTVIANVMQALSLAR